MKEDVKGPKSRETIQDLNDSKTVSKYFERLISDDVSNLLEGALKENGYLREHKKKGIHVGRIGMSCM